MGDPHQKVSRDTISCVRFLVVLNEGVVKQPQIVATIPAEALEIRTEGQINRKVSKIRENLQK